MIPVVGVIVALSLMLMFSALGVGWVLSTFLPVPLVHGAWLWLACLATVSAFAAYSTLLDATQPPSGGWGDDDDEEEDVDDHDRFEEIARETIDSVVAASKRRGKRR